MRILSIFLALMILIAGVLSCAEPIAEEPVEYTLTIYSDQGGEVTTPGEGQFTYGEGTIVSLVAASASGYYFGGWTGDVSTIANTRAASTTITMNGDYSITANFQVIPVAKYNLTVSSTEGGSVTAPGEATFTYDAGTTVDLVAEAEEGYQFTEWTGSVGAVDDVNAASTTVTMMGDYSITANFVKEIRNWYDLDAIREGLNGSYVLMNDLDSATAGYAELAGPTADDGRGWQPIGGLVGDPFIDDIAYPAERFAGKFDGRGFEMRDLYINRISEEGVGLFGSIDEAGLVRNVVLVDATVTGRVRVGGLVGENLGSLSDSCFRGSVTGEWFVGGLVGHNLLGTISNSYCSGSVIATDRYAGGLAGLNHGIVSNSHYDLDALLVNGKRIITVGALSTDDFENWLSGDRFLDISERLTQEEGYYLLDNLADLKQLLAFGQDASLRFRLTSDLDLAAESNFYVPYLAGTFDGSEHTIRNLNIDLHSASQVGLFGYLAPNARVTHVGAENVSIAGHGYVGSLVGWNRGEVSNSYSTGSVSAGWGVGGLVGALEGTLLDCSFTGSVAGGWGVGGLAGDNFSGTVSNSYFIGTVSGSEIGGIVGHNYGNVNNSYYDFGQVLLNGQNVITIGALIGEDFEQWLANDKALDAGERLSQEAGYYLIDDLSDLKELLAVGQDSSLRFRLMNNLDLGGEADFYIPYLAGEFDGNGHTIANLNVNVGFISQVGLFGYVGHSGKVKAVIMENINISGCRNLGGVVGGNAGTVTDSHSAGSVSGEWHIGGLVGYNNWGGTVGKSCSSSSVTGNASIGGLIGVNVGALTNCCSVGTVTGQWYYVGGLVGDNAGAVSRSYSAGRVIGLHHTGGLVGRDRAWATVSNSFWDREASGQEESAGGTGKTTVEMKSIATFGTAGWSIIGVAAGDTDRSRTWNIVDGQTYPFLSWQPVS